MHRRLGLTAACSLALISRVTAQTSSPEIEPNSVKPEATVVSGLLPGDTITGTTTGIAVTAGDSSSATADVFRVRTAALPLGIYSHTLTVTSSVDGITSSIRGALTAPGSVGQDFELQPSVTGTTRWYGFGKQEEHFYSVVGKPWTTSPYVATFASVPVQAIVVPGVFLPGNVTVTTFGQGHNSDTEIYVYDSNLDPIPFGHSDGVIGLGYNPSIVSLPLSIGRYYVAVAFNNTANDRSDVSPTEINPYQPRLDLPDALVTNYPGIGLNVGFAVTDSVTTTQVPATLTSTYRIVWATFTVNTPVQPPPNDGCSTGSALTAPQTINGDIANATNDGVASCDPGSFAPADVWFRFTDPTAVGGVLTLDTCGSGFDTLLSVHASCGGAELACNDDCGGPACTGTDSCLAVSIAPGQTVRVRIADKSGLGGAYVLHSSFIGTPPVNDDCANAIPVTAPGVYGFNTRWATSGSGIPLGTCVTPPAKDIWYTYTATYRGQLQISMCNQFNGTHVPHVWIYSWSAGCPTNPVTICSEMVHNCTSQGIFVSVNCGQTITIQLGHSGLASPTSYLSGTFTLYPLGQLCVPPSTVFCEGNVPGQTCTLCNNTGIAGRGCSNQQSASGARLGASGGASVGNDSLFLHAQSVSGPGLYFQGSGPLSAPIMFGDGMLCVTNGVVRLAVGTPTPTSVTYPNPTTPTPVSITGGPLAAGDIRHYQFWYRDASTYCTSATFNLTNGITLTWTP